MLLERLMKLNDKNSVLEWLSRWRLLRSEPPKCHRHKKNMKVHEVRHGFGQVWRCTTCKTDISITRGSLFERLHLEPGTALIIMWSFAQGNTYDEIIRDTQPTPVSSATIASWYKELRSRLIKWMETEPRFSDMIGGPGKNVQIDETLIGKRKYNVGRQPGGEQFWVLGMIDEDDQLRVFHIENKSASVMIPLIVANVDPQSEVWTDQHRTYMALDNMGWDHSTVNHSVQFKAPDGTHTNKIESAWRGLKRWFNPGGIPHESIEEHIKHYLWLRDCKKRGLNPFAELVKICEAK